MTFVDLVSFRRVSTAVMVLVMTAFLGSAALGAVRGGHPTGLTPSLAGVALVLGLVVAALRPTVSVMAEVFSCGYSGRTKTCSGKYTVDGVRYTGDMPVRPVRSDRKAEIDVLAADHHLPFEVHSNGSNPAVN